MTTLTVLLALIAHAALAAPNAVVKPRSTVESVAKFKAVLWEKPADIASRDLYYGIGGKKHQPRGREFIFVKEDLDGSNPKYWVKDADGVKWKIKLGTEAQPETVATRLVWAVGYFTDEDYLLPNIVVRNIPANLRRGRDMIEPDGTMLDARLQRERDTKKIGDWEWRHAPFAGTRQFNGLRVLMAVINNWDLKDVNNHVYEKRARDDLPERFYIVHDLGASFGSPGRRLRLQSSKGNLEEYEKSKFIGKIEAEFVDFNVPARPTILFSLRKNPLYRLQMTWIGKHIPRDDARWMGELLGRLSPKQIRDAFRAAYYSPEAVERFAAVVERRIAELKSL
jgi:hypothetical protein